MMPVLIIDLVLFCIAGGLLVYLGLLSLLALAGRLRTVRSPSASVRFAVVIPAHNEETSIARTVRSFMAVDYPKTLYDVIVIADNCTDGTAAAARAAGAGVMERSDLTRKSKGYALRWCFDRILSGTESYGGVIVVDADSVVSPNFLGIMSSCLESGHRAIQSKDIVEPQPGVWSAEIIRFGFTLYNHVRPLGRSVLGFPAGLRGNGMCFSADLLRRIPWCTYGLNEDLEFGLILHLAGEQTEFAPEATVFATMPANPKNAESQRARWEQGRFRVVRTYAPRLLRAVVRRGSVSSLDALVDLLMPPFVNLFGTVIMLTVINIAFALAGMGWAVAMTPYWLAAIAAGVIHVLAGLLAADADRDLYRTFLQIPRYALWKILLYIKMLLGSRAREWVRTTRE